MEEKKGMPGWIKGCLTGCAVLLLLAVILMTFVCQQVKSMFEGVVEAEQSFKQLSEELGDYDAYNPDAMVSVSADRMERFLRIRENLADERLRMEDVFESFDLTVDEELSGPRKVWSVLSALGGLVNPAGEYLAVRNAKLVEEQMSMGEYAWIYALSYYSWLGHEITAGPTLSIDGKERDLFEDGDSPLSPRQQHRRYRRVMIALFKNQISAVPESDPERLEQLRQELARFENAPRSVIWEGGLPAADAAVLEPVRDRLEATWHSPTNVMEMPFPEEGRGVRFRVN